MNSISLGLCAALLASATLPAAAQEKRSITARVGLGAQVRPDYPGSDRLELAPLWDVSTRHGSDLFEFEAPDESFGFALLSGGDFQIGPALGLEGSRRESEVGAPVGKVSTTFEAGAFAQYHLSESLRLRGEVRHGIGGHDGLVSSLGADFVARRGDDWLLSIGPRLLISDADHQRAYFGVTPQVAAATGLPAFQPDGGVYGAGAAASLLYSFGGRWGVSGYARYERLLGDAADSPITRAYGSANQLSGGLALTYTFRVRRGRD